MYSLLSLTFRKFTELCKCHHDLVLEHFHHLQSHGALLQVVPASRTSNRESVFCPYRLAFSGHFTSLKLWSMWFFCIWLFSFSILFEVHLYYSWISIQFLFTGESNVIEWIYHCLSIPQLSTSCLS